MCVRGRAICSLCILSVILAGLFSTLASTTHPKYSPHIEQTSNAMVQYSSPISPPKIPAQEHEEPDLVMLLVGLGVCGSGLLSLKSRFSSH